MSLLRPASTVLTAGACALLLGSVPTIAAAASPATAHVSLARHGNKQRHQGREATEKKDARLASVPCANSGLTPTESNLAAIRTATFCLVNRERERNGELPLLLSSDLAHSAQEHSQNMVGGNYFEHVSPTGSTPLSRIRSSGFIPNSHVGYAIGENIGWGSLWLASPKAIVAAWISSPGHLANILDSKYTYAAIGVVAGIPASRSTGQAGAIYTQDFGAIIH